MAQLKVCECCGLTFSFRASPSDLKDGKGRFCSRSCWAKFTNTRHGKTRTPEYTSWDSMIQRCTNPRATNWRLYGGRGIQVCQRWLNSFEAFFDDMGPRPAGMTLDRIDCDGHYEPGNCRWATVVQQGNNRRASKRIVVEGVSKTVAEWARDTGIAYNTLLGRLAAGMDPASAVSTAAKPAYRMLSYGGRTMNLSEWAVALGVTPGAISRRIARGMPPADVFSAGKFSTSPKRRTKHSLNRAMCEGKS